MISTFGTGNIGAGSEAVRGQDTPAPFKFKSIFYVTQLIFFYIKSWLSPKTNIFRQDRRES
jgi:hypothetical protein